MKTVYFITDKKYCSDGLNAWSWRLTRQTGAFEFSDIKEDHWNTWKEVTEAYFKFAKAFPDAIWDYKIVTLEYGWE